MGGNRTLRESSLKGCFSPFSGIPNAFLLSQEQTID